MTADVLPTLILLHALGGSARSWNVVVAKLAGFDCVQLDLPGFGYATADSEPSIEQTVDSVIHAIRMRSPRRWMLVGHSMGGKIASIVARRAEQGTDGLAGLVGVVLLAASPPAPEPIDEQRRDAMIGWVTDGPISEAHAAAFVDENVANPLAPAYRHAAIEEVMRSDRHAWLGWLQRGSREDWSDVVGVLQTPAMVVAGSEDGDLGIDAQRRLNGPHYPRARIETVAGAAHLLPIERPDAVAALIRDHWKTSTKTPEAVPADFARLLASDRVSVRTRAILLDRALPDDPDYASRVFSKDQFATLRSLIDRVLPQDAPLIDLAARIDTALADGPGDGWRFAELPVDVDAYRRGLDTLDVLTDARFTKLAPDEQDAWLTRCAEGSAGIEDVVDRLTPNQMQLWFDDVRADAARTWLSHPATMARIGYDGIANGGDGQRLQGFQQTHADNFENWEPAPQRTPAR